MDLIKPLALSSCVVSGIAVRCGCPTRGGTHEAYSNISVDALKWNSVSLSLSCGAALECGGPYGMTTGKRCPTLMLI